MSTQTRNANVPEIRKAERRDIEEWYQAPMPGFIAWIAVFEGEPIAIWGFLHFMGRWYLVFDLKEQARKFPVTMVKQSREMIPRAEASGLTSIWSQPDPNEPLAAKWIESLGFLDTGRGYRWRKK